MDMGWFESLDRGRAMSAGELSEHLWNKAVPHDASGNGVLFEQYKLYIEMADRISGRRDAANTFFLTLNSVILGSGAWVISKGVFMENKWLLGFPALVLFLELYFWWRVIISYKQLNGAKFKIIGELEEKLPARPYGKAEWHFLLKEGKDRSVYWPLTHLESKVPWIFFLGYIIVICAAVFSK